MVRLTGSDSRRSWRQALISPRMMMEIRFHLSKLSHRSHPGAAWLIYFPAFVMHCIEGCSTCHSHPFLSQTKSGSMKRRWMRRSSSWSWKVPGLNLRFFCTWSFSIRWKFSIIVVKCHHMVFWWFPRTCSEMGIRTLCFGSSTSRCAWRIPIVGASTACAMKRFGSMGLQWILGYASVINIL